MSGYSCKCGNAMSTAANKPKPCQGCSRCGTTLELPWDKHETPKPHEMLEDIRQDAKGFFIACKNCSYLKRLEEPEKATPRLLYETIQRLHVAEDHGFEFELCVQPICDGVIQHLALHVTHLEGDPTIEQRYGGEQVWNNILEAEKAAE